MKLAFAMLGGCSVNRPVEEVLRCRGWVHVGRGGRGRHPQVWGSGRIDAASLEIP